MTTAYRLASYEDHVSIAHIHATNWKENYQDVLDSDYLIHHVDGDRQEVWKKRLGLPKSNQYVYVALVEDCVIGFVCAYLNYDETFGHYIDNLHVLDAYQGRGIGKQLIHYVATVAASTSDHTKLFLYVFESNHAAIRTYKYWGAHTGKTEYLNMPSGGGGGVASCMIWSDCHHLRLTDSESLLTPEYKPLACHLYDHLEIVASRSTEVEIILIDYPKSIIDQIRTIETVGKIEYLITKGDYQLRLDRIEKIIDRTGNLMIDLPNGIAGD